MNREDYEQMILHYLREQQIQYSAMQPQDTVKFIFQAMLGVGHLLSSRDRVEQAIRREMGADSGKSRGTPDGAAQPGLVPA